MSDSAVFYVYGVTMSVVALGFYLYGLSRFNGGLMGLFNFLFSISAAWVLSVSFLGGIEALSRNMDLQFNWFVFLVGYIFPFIVFIGFQLLLYRIGEIN